MWEPNLEDANRWHNAHDYYEEQESTTCRECPEFRTFDWSGDDCGICQQYVDEYARKYCGGLLTLSAIDAGGIEDADTECPFKGVQP